jgi:hypothetical protein
MKRLLKKWLGVLNSFTYKKEKYALVSLWRRAVIFRGDYVEKSDV